MFAQIHNNNVDDRSKQDEHVPGFIECAWLLIRRVTCLSASNNGIGINWLWLQIGSLLNQKYMIWLI